MLLNRKVKIVFFTLVILASLSYYFDFPNSTYNAIFDEDLGQQSLESIYSDTNYLDYPSPTKLNSGGESLIIDTPGCQIPDTFLKVRGQVREWWKNPCPGWSFTFMKQINVVALNLTRSSAKNAQCCYSVIVRELDTNIRANGPCIPISNENIVDSPTKFVQVTCHSTLGVSTEFHYILHPKMEEIDGMQQNVDSSNKNNTVQTDSNSELDKLLHIVILGIDSVARQHLHQYMPKTRKTLERLGAVEFHGFNKVGENTHPNVVPLLTGYSVATLPCNHTANAFVDSCPFLWNELKAKTNYMTGLAEDAPKIAIFNYKKVGFKKEPVDFYLRPLMWMANQAPANANGFTFPCVEPGKSTESFMLQYVQDVLKYSESHLKQPLFILNWLTSLAHENTQNLERNDNIFASFFEKINKEQPNAYIIFMSDHGYRYDNIKDKRNSRNGWFNEKLPFLFIKIPDTKDIVRQHRLKALQKNSRKLVTLFDVHKTLRELLKLPFEGETGFSLTGQSLFSPILSTRTCESAGIPKIFCTCTNLQPLQLTSPIILQSALASVQHINTHLPGKCKQFQLARITGAAVLANYTSYPLSSSNKANQTKSDIGNKTIELAIGFRIKPGQFDFESTVRVITVSDNYYSPLTSSSKRNEEIDRMRTNTVIQVKDKILRTSPVEVNGTIVTLSELDNWNEKVQDKPDRERRVIECVKFSRFAE